MDEHEDRRYEDEDRNRYEEEGKPRGRCGVYILIAVVFFILGIVFCINFVV